MKTPGVYGIRNKVNGKLYIGSGTTSIEDRIYSHFYMLRKGEHHSPHLQQAWNKYKESAFEGILIEKCDPSICLSREQYWIDRYQTCNPKYGYNVCPVAGSRKGVPSPQVAEANRRRQYDSETQARKVRGLTRSIETRHKMSESRKNYWSEKNKRQEASIRVKEWWRRRKMKTRLNCYEFGKKLLETNDLDPVYIVLYEAQLPIELLKRWLLSFWCFYHSGTASWISEGKGRDGIADEQWFLDRLLKAAKSKDYPRCPERRHFRGQNALDSVAFISEWGVEGLWEEFGMYSSGRGKSRSDAAQGRVPASEVMGYVQEWVGFGPWIAFKVADMLERLGILDIDFSDAAIYKSPREGAEELWKSLNGFKPYPPRSNYDVTKWAMDDLLEHLGEHKAPPRYERYVSYQEAETILCKWHSHLNGHYEVGEDIISLKKALLQFAKCKTSQALLMAGKRAELW